MNEKLDWTQKLGDAFLADQKAVLDDGAGAAPEGATPRATSSPRREQKVKTETVEQQDRLS